MGDERAGQKTVHWVIKVINTLETRVGRSLTAGGTSVETEVESRVT